MKDPDHWLYRFEPDEWVQAALAEMARAEQAYRDNNPRAGHAAARRAAGMALNAALIAQPNEAWGRSYMDHIKALRAEPAAPEAVREAARLLLDTPAPGFQVIALRSRSLDDRLLEAARTLMAHAYALVARGASGEACGPALP